MWFAAAVIVPCAALFYLGIRALHQEELILRQRAAEHQQARVSQVSLALESAIEPIRLSASPPAGIAFHGVIRGGRVLLSWETAAQAVRMAKALADPEYQRLLRSPSNGSPQFEGAPLEFLRLQRALALNRSGNATEAAVLIESLSRTPASITDEQSVPIALYAIPNLASVARRRAALESITAQVVADPCLHSPTALKMLSQLYGEQGLTAELQNLRILVRNAEAAQRFQDAFPRDVGALTARWLVFDDLPYLVGFASAPAGEFVFRGLSASTVAASLPQHPRLVRTGGSPLGPPFAGLQVILPIEPGRDLPTQRPLVLGIIALALCIAVAGCILLWRDIRRDAQVAALRTQFVASISHELRTPLTALRMFTEALHDNPEIDNATRQDYLSTMLSENERLSRLVENVLEFSRIERNQRKYVLRPVLLPEILDSVLASIDPLIERGGFRLERNIDREIPPVPGDRDALGQALFNLLSNAMKYSGASRDLRIELSRQGQHAAIRVTDSGVGIPPAEHRLIFDSFYRSAAPENSAVPGAGLGLTLVRHVMEGHHGQVTVDSTPGKGSTFSLILPLAKQEGNP